MPATARGFVYPTDDDDPDFPGDIQALAESVEAGFDAAQVDAGATQTTASSSTSGTFAAPTNAISHVFTAPPSGNVLLLFKAEAWATTGYGAVVGLEIRTGSVIGSGSQVLAASDADAFRVFNDPRQQGTSFVYYDSLTPGDTYHARLMIRVSTAGQTVNIERGKIACIPG